MSSVQNDSLVVVAGAKTLPARRAFSCLIEPKAGDIVQIASIDGTLYVLAILHRPGLGDGVLSLADPAAALTVSAQAVTVRAATAVQIEAPAVTIASASARLLAGALTWVGRTCTLMGDRIATLAKQQDAVAQHHTTRAGTRTSVVDGVDVVRVGSRVSDVETVTTERSVVSLHAPKEDFRVAATRITLG